MSALPRLLDDPSVSETLRADLRRAQMHAVAPFDTAVGLERLRARMESGGGPIAPPGGGTLPGSPWKLFAALGVAGAVGWLLLSGSPENEAPTAIPLSSAPAPIAPSEPEAAPASSGQVGQHEEPRSLAIESPSRSAEKREPVPSTVARTAVRESRSDVSAPQSSAPQSSVPQSSVPQSSVPQSSVPPSSVPPNKSDPFADEILHLGTLRQLHHTDPVAAVVSAREGHKKFPEGVLYEEREALLILSLSVAGRSTEAERRAADFRARFPRSAFLSKMQKIVPTAEEPPPAKR